MTTWITINKRLLEASALINSAPIETFTHILHLITNQGIITGEDLVQLNETLNYTDDLLQLLVQSILHIYKKAMQIVTKPNTLQRDLEDKLQIQPEKAETFVKVWTDVTKQEFGDLDKRKKLDQVAWALHLKTMSSHNPPGSKFIEPTSRLQLSLSDFDNKAGEKTTLELDNQGLEQLYKVLENIQSKLDTVNAVKS